jgi:hypothetical protein
LSNANDDRLAEEIVIGIGRSLATPLLPHHLAYGSRTKAVRLIRSVW